MNVPLILSEAGDARMGIVKSVLVAILTVVVAGNGQRAELQSYEV